MTSMTDLKLAALRQALSEMQAIPNDYGNAVGSLMKNSAKTSFNVQKRADEILAWLTKDDSPEMTLEEAMAEVRKAPLITIAAEQPLDSPKVFDQPVEAGGYRGRCSFPPATEMTDEEQAAARKMWEDSKPADRKEQRRQVRDVIREEGALAAEYQIPLIDKMVSISNADGSSRIETIRGYGVAADGDRMYATASGTILWGKDCGITWGLAEEGLTSVAEAPFDPIGKPVWVKNGGYHHQATIEEYHPATPCGDSSYRIRRGTTYSTIYGEDEGKTWAWTREGLAQPTLPKQFDHVKFYTSGSSAIKAGWYDGFVKDVMNVGDDHQIHFGFLSPQWYGSETMHRMSAYRRKWYYKHEEKTAAEPAKRKPQAGDLIDWEGRVLVIYQVSKDAFMAIRCADGETFLFDKSTEGTEGGWTYKD